MQLQTAYKTVCAVNYHTRKINTTLHLKAHLTFFVLMHLDDLRFYLASWIISGSSIILFIAPGVTYNISEYFEV